MFQRKGWRLIVGVYALKISSRRFTIKSFELRFSYTTCYILLMDNNETLLLVKKWLSIASDDLKMAVLAKEKRIFLFSAFHSQQAVEKSLKGLLLFINNESPPYIHNIVRLLRSINSTFEDIEKYSELMNELNSYYIESRYPSLKDDRSKNLDGEKIDDFITLARICVKCLENKVK